MKTCSQCKLTKEYIFFGKNKLRKDGYQNVCKSCFKEYRDANKDRLLKQKKEYYEENKETILLKAKIYKQENREIILARLRKYYAENRERLLADKKLYYLENISRIKKYRNSCRDALAVAAREYRKLNKAKYDALSAFRRAAKRDATPSWLTKEDKLEIQQHYHLRNLLSAEIGVLYHVDHIVPLRGDLVCGLHVPWNLQVITAEENLAKSNNFEII